MDRFGSSRFFALMWGGLLVVFWLFLGIGKVSAVCSTTCNSLADDGKNRCIGSGLYYCDGGVKTWYFDRNCGYGCNTSTCTCNPAPTSTPPSCITLGNECNVYSCCSGLSCSNGICINLPTNTPTPTPLPTATPTPVCEGIGDNICNTSTPYCEFTCDGRVYNDSYCSYTGTKTVKCSTNEFCYKNRIIFCNITTGISDVGNCPPYNTCTCSSYSTYTPCISAGCSWVGNLCVNPAAGTPSPPQATQGPTPTTYCQRYTCENVGSGNQCTIGGTPYFPIGGCSGASRCDNCRGTACMWCDGTTGGGTVPVPTIAGCTENCVSDPRYGTTCNNNIFTICSGTVNCYGGLGSNCGSECINYGVGTTYASPNGCGTCNGCNNLPVINSITITNNVGTSLAVETGNRNHICQSTIYNSTASRVVRFIVNASDADGGNTINSINLTWNGRNYPTTLSAASGNNRVGTVNVTFTGTDNGGGTYGVGATAVDNSGARGQLTPRSFKVWDCQVPVRGALYDGSAGQSCNNNGFTLPAGVDMGFNRLVYSGNADVEMTVNPPANYGTNNVVWGQNYLPLFNSGNAGNPGGDLAATGRFSRIIDLGVGTTNCPVAAQFNIGTNISAYSANPQAQIDFSFIQNQLSWFQVSGGGVRAANALHSGVPVTAAVANRALTLGQVLASNGFVSFSTYTNTNGFNDNTAFGIPNNWWKDRDLLPNEPFNYQYFYSNYWQRLGLGTTGTSWDQRPVNGVFLVNGNLTIDSDFVLPIGQFFMVVSSGSITIDPAVNRLDGVYIADVNIGAGGQVANQLQINGMLYARGNIRFTRTFSDATQNNTVPAVMVNYRPELVFTMPPSLTRVMSGWREE